MKKALVDLLNKELTYVGDEEFPVHKHFKWFDVPDEATDAWVFDPEQFVVVAPNPEPELTLGQTHANRLDELKIKRDQVIGAGIVLGGAEITTDNLTQQRLAAARIVAKEALDNSEEYSVDWKAANGWLVLDAAQIVAIADAVRAHVQACFTNEKNHFIALGDLLSAEDKQGIIAYDITTGWPSNNG